MYHIIDVEDILKPEWDKLYRLCCDMIDRPRDYAEACRGKLMGSLFYEPSTRTNLSFQAAMARLGGSVIGFADPGSSSVSKGETLKDTITMVSGYADVLVMRNPREGAAKAASLYASVPVINAGDGGHLHPTQTLTDLTTIQRLRGQLGGLHIGLCGDLKYGRTVHTLVKALCRYDNVHFYLISPRELAIPDYIRTHLALSGARYYEIDRLESVIPMLDVLYMTRIQRERFIDPLEYLRLKGVYILDSGKLRQAKKDLLIMHPLPRVDEIAQEVDNDPRAVYFQQAKFGMYIRMALLLTLTGLPPQAPGGPIADTTEKCCQNANCITRQEEYLPPLSILDHDGECLCGYCEKKMV